MEGGSFTGKFVRPTESYSVQHMDHAGLNRVGVEVLYGLLIVAVAALLVHFIVSLRSGKKRGDK